MNSVDPLTIFGLLSKCSKYVPVTSYGSVTIGDKKYYQIVGNGLQERYSYSPALSTLMDMILSRSKTMTSFLTVVEEFFVLDYPDCSWNEIGYGILYLTRSPIKTILLRECQRRGADMEALLRFAILQGLQKEVDDLKSIGVPITDDIRYYAMSFGTIHLM